MSRDPFEHANVVRLHIYIPALAFCIKSESFVCFILLFDIFFLLPSFSHFILTFTAIFFLLTLFSFLFFFYYLPLNDFPVSHFNLIFMYLFLCAARFLSFSFIIILYAFFRFCAFGVNHGASSQNAVIIRYSHWQRLCVISPGKRLTGHFDYETSSNLESVL